MQYIRHRTPSPYGAIWDVHSPSHPPLTPLAHSLTVTDHAEPPTPSGLLLLQLAHAHPGTAPSTRTSLPCSLPIAAETQSPSPTTPGASTSLAPTQGSPCPPWLALAQHLGQRGGRSHSFDASPWLQVRELRVAGRGASAVLWPVTGQWLAQGRHSVHTCWLARN